MKLVNCIVISALALLAILLVTPQAVAQSSYPSKTIQWIIPWNPGGSNDVLARFLQPILKKEGFTTAIENKPGGTGAVGMGAVATAPPDGYTIGNGTSSTLAIIAQGRAPLKNNQFTHVIRLSVDPLILVVAGDSKYNTLGDFLQDMKKHPGNVTIATPGTHNINHIFAAMTARAAEVGYRHVTYPGGSRVVAALLGHHVEAGVLKPSETIELIKSGDLKPLGVFADKRVGVLPKVPTFKEKGYDVFPYGPMVQMGYIDAPAGLKPQVRKRLAAAYKKALTSDKFKKFAKTHGFQISPITGERLDKTVTDVAKAIHKVADAVFKD